MERYLRTSLSEDLGDKLLLVSGPRQVGKTTLAKSLRSGCYYLNYDFEDDRRLIENLGWPPDAPYVLLDEIHKKPDWKRWLKGVYDTQQIPPTIVTGSARMDMFRAAGDSLAGRFFGYRLHPIDVHEAVSVLGLNPTEAAHALLTYGGFPEPFLKGTERFYNRWAKSHLDIILKQDLIDLDMQLVREFRKLELLIDRLRYGCGSPISANAIAQDLAVSDKTIVRWIDILEEMYLIFRVRPFHRNMARANLKQSKAYFFDVCRIPDRGARLENLVACALLKFTHYSTDVLGQPRSLHFLRFRGGEEIDFIICKDDEPELCIEVKTSETKPSKSFRHVEALGAVKRVQLVQNAKRRSHGAYNVAIEPLAPWLAKLSYQAV